LERAKGIEPSYAAWEAAVLPLNYARACLTLMGAPLAHNRFPKAGFNLTFFVACCFENTSATFVNKRQSMLK
jgi:hypothetical protein